MTPPDKISKRFSLETREVWFAYEESPPALKGISLQVEDNEFVALVGQNGSGKTTLAKHFNGLLRPSQGQVLVNGEDIHDSSVGDLASTVGYVFQNPDHQIFSHSTREEIAFGPRNLGLEEEEIQHRTEEALRFFDLEQYGDTQPALLGFGLRRKVSIAAVYSMRPQILILDEPTAGLDWKSTHNLMNLILEYQQQGHTILLITHDMRVVAEYAPKCMVLRDGQLVAYEETRNVFTQTDLLRETKIELPQISELGRRMVDDGLQPDILTVSEFCSQFGELLPKEA